MATETPEAPETASKPAFHDILAPLVHSARAQLQMALGTEGPLAAGAIPMGVEALARRLCAIAEPVLIAAFREDAPLPAVARLYDDPPDFAPRGRYAAFVDRYRGDLSRWPMLDAHLQRTCADFVCNITLFARHAEEDAAAIRQAIPAESHALFPITAIIPGLSDPHAGGRSVIKVTFAGGTQLAYKPRALAAETAFGALLAMLEGGDQDESGVPPQRRQWVLDRGDHGWMEWIQPAPLADPDDAPLFMARCGGLAACLYVVRGGDIHPDNLIAAGAFPVIVDLECLFQPSPFDLGQTDPLDDPHLFASGLLPVFTSFDGGETMVPVAASGTGPVPQRPESYVRHAGTDWLHLASRSVASFATGARLQDHVLDVRDHSDAFARGFAATLTALWRARVQLLAPGGALEGFRTVPCRLLCAPTNLYALVLDSAFGGGGASRPEAFAARLARADGRPPLIGSEAVWRKVLAAEAASLARLDVPAFTFLPEERSARPVEGGTIGDAFREPIYERAEAALHGLDDAAITNISALVRATLRPASPAPLTAARTAERALDHRHVLRQLANQVVDLAIPQGPEAVTWVRLWEQIPAFIAPAGPGLCYGATGTALFLAEAGRALDNDSLLAMAHKALHPLRTIIHRGDVARLAEQFGPGYARGIGGMIAAFSWCARLLDDPTLADEAATLAAATPQALRVADTVDLMDGAAGLALGLATLPPSAARQALAACGAALLTASRLNGDGRHWPDRRGISLPGLAHGTAGMAAALAQVHVATGEPEWLAAAREACAYEDTQFDPQTANWQARSAASTAHRLSSWCHGAPGIALARAWIGSLDPTEGTKGPGAQALVITRATPVGEVDDLCCGESGRLEILSMLTAADDTAHQAAIDAAITNRLPDWAGGGARLLAARAPGAPGDAALFRGVAGLGHLLVRRCAPAFACDILLPRSLSR